MCCRDDRTQKEMLCKTLRGKIIGIYYSLYHEEPEKEVIDEIGERFYYSESVDACSFIYAILGNVRLNPKEKTFTGKEVCEEIKEVESNTKEVGDILCSVSRTSNPYVKDLLVQEFEKLRYQKSKLEESNYKFVK